MSCYIYKMATGFVTIDSVKSLHPMYNRQVGQVARNVHARNRARAWIDHRLVTDTHDANRRKQTPADSYATLA